ncbi:MAG: zf-HC2 domain-containing protein [Vicinamibacterales bacterium]
MKTLNCAATRRRLEALHDGELSVADQIAVSSHLEWCDRCAASFSELRMLRDVLRAAAPSRVGLSAEDDERLQLGVVSRAQAEQKVSLGAALHDMFEDMHFVYAGMGSIAAALVCAVIMFGMMRSFSAEIVVAPAGPVAGSNQNPLWLLAEEFRPPRAIDEEGFGATSLLEGHDAVFAFTAVVTREGRVASIELLPPREAHAALLPQGVNELLGVASRARFEPASRDGSPVAVNLIWIVAHTTVRGTLHNELARPARGRPDGSPHDIGLLPAPLPMGA